MTESPLLQVGLPAIGAPMMNTRRERAALAAMQLVSGVPTHRLPNGLGYIAPTTGAVHGPRQEANHDGPVCASWYVDGLAAAGQTVAR